MANLLKSWLRRIAIRCRLLDTIDFTAKQVSMGELRRLSGLKNLKTLRMPPSSLTDCTLAQLRSADLLHALWCANTAEGYSSGPRPSGPEEVSQLFLDETAITDSGLRELAGLSNLNSLSLLETDVSDDGLSVLLALENLTYLRLGSRITNRGIKKLAGFTNLETLDLSYTQVDETGLRGLSSLQNLTTVIPPQLTDETLAALRATGLLHVLPCAESEAGGRPEGLEDVTTLGLDSVKHNICITDKALSELLADLPNLSTLNLTLKGITDNGIHELAKLSRLSVLGLRCGRRITDVGLKELAKLRGLKVLALEASIESSDVTDAGLEALAGLPLLSVLELDAEINDEALRILCRRCNLTKLSLPNAEVTDAGLKELSHLKNLQALDLEGATRISDAGIKELVGITKLKTLVLKDTAVTGETLGELAGLAHLRELDLSGCPVTNDGLREVAKLGGLTMLGLAHCYDLKGEGMTWLTQLKHLTAVDVNNTSAESKARDLRLPYRNICHFRDWENYYTGDLNPIADFG